MNSDSGDVVSYEEGVAQCATIVVAVFGRLIGLALESRRREFSSLPGPTLPTTPTLHLLPLDRSHPARLRHSWHRPNVQVEGKLTRRGKSPSPTTGWTE